MRGGYREPEPGTQRGAVQQDGVEQQRGVERRDQAGRPRPRLALKRRGTRTPSSHQAGREWRHCFILG